MPRNLHIEVEAVPRASSAAKGFGFPEVADTPITQFLSVSSVKISGQIFLICAFLHGLVKL